MSTTLTFNGNDYVWPDQFSGRGFLTALPALLLDVGLDMAGKAASALASQNSAAASASSAAASAASALTAATGLTASATDNTAIGAGTKAFAIGALSQFVQNSWVQVAHDASNYMIGQVVSYTGGVLTISVPGAGVFGSGTFNAWTVNISGPIGATGATGAGAGYTYQATGLTAANATQYICDTSGGAFVVALPASPSTNNNVRLTDVGATWRAHNLTVDLNGASYKDVTGTVRTGTLVCGVNGGDLIFDFDGTYWR